MKYFILLVLINFQIFSPLHSMKPLCKEYFKTSYTVHSIEDPNLNIKNYKNDTVDAISEIEITKKIYLDLIKDLSFRNTLWEQSSNFVKIDNKNSIANLWATGIRDKNGTLLYLISNDNIKLQLKDLFSNNPSWIIEDNQNVIESFKIENFKKVAKDSYTCKIVYNSKHADGYCQNLKQTIHIENINKTFKICGFSDITI